MERRDLVVVLNFWPNSWPRLRKNVYAIKHFISWLRQSSGDNVRVADLSDSLKIKVTQRANKDIKSLAPALVKTLKGLIEFKAANGNTPWGKKDIVFTGLPALRSWWHFHLVHGNDILVYKLKDGYIMLACILHHQDMDKSGSQRLTKFLDNLGPNDWYEFEFEKAAVPTLSANEKKDVEDAIFELTTHADMLRSFLAGNTEPVMEILRICVEQNVTDDEKDKMIDAAFKGQLDQFIRNAMKQLHIPEYDDPPRRIQTPRTTPVDRNRSARPGTRDDVTEGRRY